LGSAPALDHRFADLYTLVPELLDLHPGWTAADIREFVEEKTRADMQAGDDQTLAALHRRCVLLRREFEE